MITFIILLLAAALGSALAHLFRVPSIPLLMLSGAVLAELGTLLAFTEDTRIIADAITLGATFLVFFAGLRMNPRMLTRRATTLKVTLSQFIGLGALGFLTALVFGYSPITSLYLAVAVAASSTLVSMTLLSRRKQLFEPYGRLTTGVLLLQDLGVILVISLLPAVRQSWSGLGLATLKTVGLILVAAAFLKWLSVPLVTRWCQNDEARLITVLAVLFSFTALAEIMLLPKIAGAFLAGISLSAFEADVLIRSKLNSLEDFFSAVFFTALGANVAFIPLSIVPHALALVLLVLVATPMIVTRVGERNGFSTRASLESGMMLAQTSEFSLLTALAGMESGLLAPEVFSLIALVTFLTMLFTPLVSSNTVVWGILRRYPISTNLPENRDLQDHIVLVGAGATGRKLLGELDQKGFPTVVIETDPAIAQELQEQGMTVVQGDGADPRVLRAAGAPQARAVLCTLPRLEEKERLLRELDGPLVIVRHDDPATAGRIRELGGHPVSYVESAARDVTGWLKARSRKA